MLDQLVVLSPDSRLHYNVPGTALAIVSGAALPTLPSLLLNISKIDPNT
jgi:hypothetical protein